jgi:hypothetical protein
MEKLEQALVIFIELKMPRERDVVQALLDKLGNGGRRCRRYAAQFDLPLYPGLAPRANFNAAAARLVWRQTRRLFHHLVSVLSYDTDTVWTARTTDHRLLIASC